MLHVLLCFSIQCLSLPLSVNSFTVGLTRPIKFLVFHILPILNSLQMNGCAKEVP